MKCRWNRTMLNLCGIVAAILKMVTARHFSISGYIIYPQIQDCPISTTFHMWVDYVSWYWKISSGRHFQNGRHNTAQIQHCPISTTFHMWVDYVSRYWKMSSGHHFQNGRHNTAQIQHCPISTTFHMCVDYDVQNWFLTS
jgi:hypothetical protein